MKSNYKKLGKYIREISKKNRKNEVTKLLGVSIKKEFIPSIANTIGTDMSRYKIVRENQFAYGPVTSRNGEKISVALLQESDCIISTSYTVFEIIDPDELLPEYLMMWFRRPEFDRYARFMSHGSVREIFGWEEMCDVELPVPAIEKQREIVAEYNTIVKRIELNNSLIEKLEETAQAIYSHWFVDFEFPDENGQPYKSSGGAMQWNEEFAMDIPKGWRIGEFGELDLDVSDGNYSSKYPRRDELAASGIPFIRGTDFESKCINPFNLQYLTPEKHKELQKGHTKEGDILITNRGKIGQYAYVTKRFVDANINSQLVRINGGKKYPTAYLGCLITSKPFRDEMLSSTTGTALQQLPNKNLMKLKVTIPDDTQVLRASKLLAPLHEHLLLTSEENFELMRLQSVLLSKLAIKEN
jgi:type I restriction enzyme, S subunit